jgi:hypothetical protein
MKKVLILLAVLILLPFTVQAFEDTTLGTPYTKESPTAKWRVQSFTPDRDGEVRAVIRFVDASGNQTIPDLIVNLENRVVQLAPPVCSDVQYTNRRDCEGAGTCSDVQWTNVTDCTDNAGTWTPETWTPEVRGVDDGVTDWLTQYKTFNMGNACNNNTTVQCLKKMADNASAGIKAKVKSQICYTPSTAENLLFECGQ